MADEHSNDPLYGVTLELIITRLVEHYGWAEVGERINIRCFTDGPSIKSSLKIPAKTPWARQKVEGLYLATRRARLRKGRSPQGD